MQIFRHKFISILFALGQKKMSLKRDQLEVSGSVHMYLVMIYFTYTVFSFVLLLVFGVVAHSLYLFSIAGALECRQMVENGLSISPVTNLMCDVLTLLPNG